MRVGACMAAASLLAAACTQAATEAPSRRGPAVVAEPGPGFPSQPEGVPYPTEAWPEGTWPDGIDRTAIDEAVDRSFADGGEPRVRAVVVVHGGEIVYERYSLNPQDGATKIMPSYSMAKSITSALVGILVREGRLDVDGPAPVSAWGGEGDRRGRITVDDLIHMSSGLAWIDGADDPDSDMIGAITSGDAAGYAADQSLAHAPGTEFLYSGGDTFLLDGMIADVVGAGSDFRAFMDDELFEVLGMGPMHLEFDGAGTWLGAYAADTTARSFAKFGLLYLRDGVWEGRRILPEGWVEYTQEPSRTNPIYGAHWWLDPERPAVLYAVGVGGQVITVDPEHDLTFVHLATLEGGDLALPVSEAILDAFAAAD
jgi:CubicO group peptidase (beta-lactamase class C family)